MQNGRGDLLEELDYKQQGTACTTLLGATAAMDPPRMWTPGTVLSPGPSQPNESQLSHYQDTLGSILFKSAQMKWKRNLFRDKRPSPFQS